ncbi:MAG: SIS domain-containing protein [Synergistaceae bacterium]|jgi:D-sedoheptulose 7-phosphate isomerase|nr:SIS domain-containing protein [Synergistaceae bacterium]
MSNHIISVSEKLLKSDLGVLYEIAEALLAVKKNGDIIFTAGNGGSGATASHMANDLIKGCAVNGNPGFRAVSLVDSSPVLTCLSNDFSYDDVFSFQLRSLARPGDILIVFSGSGNSPNIIKALEYARKNAIKSMAFGGGAGGKMNGLADTLMLAPTERMEEIEDMHMVYEHALSAYMRERLSAEVWY